MTRLDLSLLVAIVRFRLTAWLRRPAQVDRREKPAPTPWPAAVPLSFLPTERLPLRTPGLALIRERVALQMVGILPHTSHKAAERVPRVRAGWVTTEFERIVARSYEAVS